MGAKILIIDDDDDYVESVQTLLEFQGYTVTTALDGDTGIALANEGSPDCILLDVMMKHSSEGLDVAQKLHDNAKTADIPVVLITGIRKPQNLSSSYTDGDQLSNIKGTFEKPIKPDELLRIIAKMVNI